MTVIYASLHWKPLPDQSLLEYKATDVERQRFIFVEPLSDSIHIALWRNYGFLHLFHDFSKNYAFSENLIKTNFILHKIFFQMSILSNGKTLWMFFNLNLKMTSIFSAYNNYYHHDTVRSFELIFMKFMSLVRVHTWVNHIIFGNNRSNRTTDMGENVPSKLVFWLLFSRYGVFWGKNVTAVFGTTFPIENWFFGFHSAGTEVFEEKFQNRIRYPISHKRGYIHFCHPTSHSLKWSCPPICDYFGKYCFVFFFLQKLLYKKYSKTHFLQKSLYWFLLPDVPFPSKCSCPPTNSFSQFFQHNWRTSSEVFPLKSILARKKIFGE